MRSSTPSDVDTEDSTLRKRFFSRAFYWVFRVLSGVPIEPGSADFRLMSREPVDALNGTSRATPIHSRARSLAGVSTDERDVSCPRAMGGPSQIHIPPQPAAGPRRRDGIQPVSTAIGRGLRLLCHGVSFTHGLFALIWQLLGGHTVKGWTSLMICVNFFGGCQLATIGILSEYLGRTLDQVKGRPLFILRAARGFAHSSTREQRAIPAPHFAGPNRESSDGGFEAGAR